MGNLTKAGSQWVAELVFLDHGRIRPEGARQELKAKRNKKEVRLKGISAMVGIDIDNSAWDGHYSFAVSLDDDT